MPMRDAAAWPKAAPNRLDCSAPSCIAFEARRATPTCRCTAGRAAAGRGADAGRRPGTARPVARPDRRDRPARCASEADRRQERRGSGGAAGARDSTRAPRSRGGAPQRRTAGNVAAAEHRCRVAHRRYGTRGEKSRRFDQARRSCRRKQRQAARTEARRPIPQQAGPAVAGQRPDPAGRTALSVRGSGLDRAPICPHPEGRKTGPGRRQAPTHPPLVPPVAGTVDWPRRRARSARCRTKA